jgi:glycosyltransferase involved in cell wall biosynthesis
MSQASSSLAPRTYVVGCDAKSNMRVFSGTTYHLALQGMEDGLLSGMVNLFPRGVTAWRIYARAGWWKLKAGFGRRGYKFTDDFLDALWRRHLPRLKGAKIINNFQLFGSHFLRAHRAFEIEPYYYIDGTLREYFGGYGAFDMADIGASAIAQALAVEREGYASCRKIVVMSRRTATAIVQHYDVSRDQLRIVPPGANIPERLLAALDQGPERRPHGRALTVGFIGLYPERKGLPIIADGVQLLRKSGYDVRLNVIGKCPPHIAQQDGVANFGVIDKRVHIDRFLKIIRGLDIGCMLSRAELTGIALLEFLRLGVPVIATDVGGIPDILELGAGQLVSPDIRANDLAERLARLVDAPERLEELRQNAWRRRQNASWRRVVRELKDVLRR